MTTPMRGISKAEYDRRWNEHRKIEKRYMSIMHTMVGKVWEIPECCIKQFVKETCVGIMVAQYRILTHEKQIPVGYDYVPCDECMKKI